LKEGKPVEVVDVKVVEQEVVVAVDAGVLLEDVAEEVLTEALVDVVLVDFALVDELDGELETITDEVDVEDLIDVALVEVCLSIMYPPTPATATMITIMTASRATAIPLLLFDRISFRFIF
jgi:hypothetical protein